MKTKIWLGALLLCLATLSAAAGEKPVTLVGTIACAKCVLQVDGQTACQNVLVVEEKEGKDHHGTSSVSDLCILVMVALLGPTVNPIDDNHGASKMVNPPGCSISSVKFNNLPYKLFNSP